MDILKPNQKTMHLLRTMQATTDKVTNYATRIEGPTFVCSNGFALLSMALTPKMTDGASLPDDGHYAMALNKNKIELTPDTHDTLRCLPDDWRSSFTSDFAATYKLLAPTDQLGFLSAFRVCLNNKLLIALSEWSSQSLTVSLPKFTDKAVLFKTPDFSLWMMPIVVHPAKFTKV